MIHTKLKVTTLTQPYKADQNGTPKYILTYIKDSKVGEIECTEEAYARVLLNNYHYATRKEITLGINPTTNIVDRVDAQEKKAYFDKTKDAEGNSMEAPYLIFSVFSDQSVELKAKPNNVSAEVATEILDYLYANHKTLKAFDIILDKYLVADIRQGGQYIYIDPTSR